VASRNARNLPRLPRPMDRAGDASGSVPLSHHIPPDFASELSRLMDEHGVDRQTARAALRGRRGRSKSLQDVKAGIEIALLAEGIRDPLQDFINGTLFDQGEVEKVKPCAAARLLADYVEGNTHPSKIEKLRRGYRKHEKFYKDLAEISSAIIVLAFRWRHLRYRSDAEMTSLEQNISTLMKDPWVSWYISQIRLPQISEYREELSARIRELDKEKASLVKRREELEIIHVWHFMASVDGFAVSEGTGKKQLQEAIDGFNALRTHWQTRRNTLNFNETASTEIDE